MAIHWSCIGSTAVFLLWRPSPPTPDIHLSSIVVIVAVFLLWRPSHPHTRHPSQSIVAKTSC